MNFGYTKTGREDRVIFWCRCCGWRGEPQPWPLRAVGVGTNKCPECPAGGGLSFVAYQSGAEEGEVRRLFAEELLPEPVL